MATLLFDVRDALLTQFTAALTGKDTTIFPGPRAAGANPKKYLLIGADGGDTGAEATDDGMSAEQGPSDLGPGTWRDEAGTVVCAAWAWTGNSTAAASEAAARDVFDTCTDALAADRSLAGLLTATGGARLSSVDVLEGRTKQGPYVRIVFGVSYGALITT